MNNKKHIIVGLSGGVDSAVSAYLLKEAGHHVEAIFMKNWEADDTDTYCPAEQDMADAQAVSDKLNIPFHTVNFANEYWERVFAYFLDEYRAGRTPNPDILCNREIKFKAFLEYAKLRGADYIATGHYVQTKPKMPFENSTRVLKEPKDHILFADRLAQGCASRSQEQFRLQKECDPSATYANGTQLLKGSDPQKDQSYFLHALDESQLSQSLFPIGHLTKPEVRNLAEKIGLSNHAKKDSTGICFIGERKFKTFLNEYLPAQPGIIETIDGEKIGTHDGLMFYTIGQRQGLHIGGKKGKAESPWYTAGKDLKRNVLIVVQGEDHPALFKQTLIASQLHWINGTPSFPLRVATKTRYRQPDQACLVEPSENGLYRVTFDTPQRAITPGQSVVFYQEEICLGGGIIEG